MPAVCQYKLDKVPLQARATHGPSHTRAVSTQPPHPIECRLQKRPECHPGLSRHGWRRKVPHHAPLTVNPVKPADKTLRLDRYLATVTDYSRSEVKRLIKRGEVVVDGATATNPASQIAPDTTVTLAGESLREARPRYFMLYKPQGYVCATRDRRHMTVLELLDEDNPEKLHAAGRLDIDTTGLVLLTDDGQWSHLITSPQRQCWKRYYVETAEPVSARSIEHLERGVFLSQEKARTLPARIEQLEEDRLRIWIQEGRYHQVKRMFAAEGNAVDILHREAIGGIELDPDLQEGEYRALTDNEVNSVLSGNDPEGGAKKVWAENQGEGDEMREEEHEREVEPEGRHKESPGR